MKEMIPLQFPVTLGGDIFGKVVELGADVNHIAVGDMVYGQANVVAGNSGALAEYAATVGTQVATAPKNLTPDEAASLPLVGVSALQALTEHIGLKAGQKILITGGSGGIGQIAIQIAKHLGAYVATSASGEGVELAKALGADEVFDYKTEDYAVKLHGYDAAFDTVGGDELNRTISVLKDGGTAVSMAGQPQQKEGIQSISQMTHVSTEKLDQLTKLVEAGVVRPNVGKVFTLEDIQQAFELREAGTMGKVVITIKM